MEIKISICRDGNNSVLKEFSDKKSAIQHLNDTLPTPKAKKAPTAKPVVKKAKK